MHLGGDYIKDEKLDRITLSYDLINGEYLSEHGKESWLILALLSRNYTIRSEFVFQFRYLFEGMGITLNRKENKEKVIRCVNSIFNTDFDVRIDINKTIRLPYQSPKSNYLMLYDEEVDYLMSCKRKIDKINLFNTYVIIKRYIHHITGIAYPSIEGISYATNVASNNSILNYIEILEEMNLIKCYREDKYIVTKDGIKRPNNSYELVKYKPIIIIK